MSNGSYKINNFIKDFNLRGSNILIHNYNAKQSYIKRIILIRYPNSIINSVIPLPFIVIHLPFIYKKLPVVWEYNVDDRT